MNRIEFMEELSGLLQDIPEEDRMDALNYYNDYFDDAGAENEKNVIDELESPEKVAAKIKADREDPEDGKAGMPMEQDNKPWTNKWLKMILIGCPVIVPVAISLLAAIAGILIAAFAFFIAIVIGFAAIVIVAIVLTAAGIGSMFVNIGAGLALFGAGMILIAVGAIGTVTGIRLCIIVFPGMIRGIVWILRKPFHRKEMA